MKPSHTTTLSRTPQGEREGRAVGALLDAATACFRAFRLGTVVTTPPEGLDELFSGGKPERIAGEVAECTRTVTFVSLYGDHASADVTFSEGKRAVKLIRINLPYDTGKLVLVTEASNPAT